MKSHGNSIIIINWVQWGYSQVGGQKLPNALEQEGIISIWVERMGVGERRTIVCIYFRPMVHIKVA